jgi:hypothetical protein
MSRKRRRQAAARAKARAKIERPADTRLDLADVLAVYDCSNEAVSSWLDLCEFRRAG